MKILYLDCPMGAAGDMLTAALLELTDDPELALQELNALGIPCVVYTKESSVKCGVKGTHMHVLIHGEEECHSHEDGHEHSDKPADGHPHKHHSMTDIAHLIGHLHASDSVKNKALSVYRMIADAESRVHGVPVEEIHFHEVGTMDAVADVMAVCFLMERLQPDRVVVSPIATGYGQVHCAHGALPVPAPATALILEGMPSFAGNVEGELLTPTGAALLKTFASAFGQRPLMTVTKSGYGMGFKDFPAANCVRALLGESNAFGKEKISPDEMMYELSCNVDDMTAEDISYACDRLFEGGAREVYTVPIGMKKGRSGILLRVITAVEQKEELIHRIFLHTTTIGIRETETKRYVLKRRTEQEDTPYGPVRKKISEGYGVQKEKLEHDDLERIAGEQGISISEVRKQIRKGKI